MRQKKDFKSFESCVLKRETGTKSREDVLYAVPAGPWKPQQAGASAEAASEEGGLTLMPVSRIPLTPAGELDVDTLKSFPILDDASVREWESRLRAVAGVEHAAVVLHNVVEPEARLHLSDLLPDWHPMSETPPPSIAAEAETTNEPLKPRPPSYSNGGPLIIPADAPKTLTEALIRTACKFPNKGMIFGRADGTDFFLSYADLLTEAKRILAGLQKMGFQPGSRAILQVESLPDHFATFWACVLGGIVPVTVAVAPSYSEPGGVVNKLHNIWKLLDRPPILTNANMVESLAGLRKLFAVF